MDCTICPVCLFPCWSSGLQWPCLNVKQNSTVVFNWCLFWSRETQCFVQVHLTICFVEMSLTKKKIHPYKWTFQYDFNQWDQSNLVPHKNETHNIRLLCNSCLVTEGWLKWLVLLLLLFFQGYKMHAFYYKWHLTGWKYLAVIFLNFNCKGAYFAVLTQRPIVSTVVCNAAFLKYSKY